MWPDQYKRPISFFWKQLPKEVTLNNAISPPPPNVATANKMEHKENFGTILNQNSQTLHFPPPTVLHTSNSLPPNLMGDKVKINHTQSLCQNTYI